MGHTDDNTAKVNAAAQRELAALEGAVAGFEAASTEHALWETFVTSMNGRGADLLSYHHSPPNYARDANDNSFYTSGFPKDWVKAYTEKNYIAIDPIIHRSRHSLNAFRWFDIETLVRLTNDQKEFLVDLKTWIKGDGLAITAFGPSGRNAYFAVGTQNPDYDWTPVHERRYFWLCQAFHHRFCELRLANLPHDFELTEREAEILNWLARGKPVHAIGGLLGARPESVGTSLSQAMKKMGVSDIPSAILRGTACGIIQGAKLARS